MASQSAASSASEPSYLPQVRIHGKNNMGTLNMREALKNVYDVSKHTLSKLLKHASRI